MCFCVSLVGHVIKNNRFLANFHNNNLKKLSLGRPEILRINLVLYLKIEIKTYEFMPRISVEALSDHNDISCNLQKSLMV